VSLSLPSMIGNESKDLLTRVAEGEQNSTTLPSVEFGEGDQGIASLPAWPARQRVSKTVPRFPNG